jgi:hypothetical protein
VRDLTVTFASMKVAIAGDHGDEQGRRPTSDGPTVTRLRGERH